MLSRDFAGLNADAILAQLLADPAYVDPRNSLTLWARPTRAVADLVAAVQRRLQELAPGPSLRAARYVWLMRLQGCGSWRRRTCT